MISIIAKVAIRFGFNPKEAERFAKFLIVGTIGFVIDFGTLTFLVEVVRLPELVAENSQLPTNAGLLLANSISFTLAVISNFTLNRYWTYPESRAKRKRVQLPQFGFVSILGLLLNNLILILTTPLFDWIIAALPFLPGFFEGYILAKILATVVVLFWNFFINRHWTYSNVK